MTRACPGDVARTRRVCRVVVNTRRSSIGDKHELRAITRERDAGVIIRYRNINTGTGSTLETALGERPAITCLQSGDQRKENEWMNGWTD